ncbi:uncharacterized protein BDZ99DRAFT_460481 [Mytilinidion resinicola]|uniref:Uncharacterized protein n=1 Tax=Mytilinidion resinicola TaxID=574789 RepID=A0A6A6YWL3_9PEZI|nr:uncharacterized protein BDZ99DRAFT_460481 [Mytilinidion resinicola]KAF2813191.1 hypothetical protein BDZ99DRAFT_460481 [Mytilinidion resinicola]
MGNTCSGLCGGGDKDHFSTPGRTLSSAPAAKPASAKLPSQKQAQRASTTGGGQTVGGTAARSADDPRAAAARAAEARLQQAKGKGKLGGELDKQKKQTMNATRVQEARDNLARKETERNAEIQKYS